MTSAVRKSLVVIAAALAALCIGCGPTVELSVRQPFAPGSQQHLRLASDWGFTRSLGGLRTCLLAFPLPGSQAGPRDFLVYVVFPDRPGRHIVRPYDPEAARGFMVQAVGAYAGKTEFAQGVIEIEQRWLDRDTYALHVDLLCADESTIVGRAELVENAQEVGQFEHNYAADVAALRMSTAPSDETRARSRVAP